MHPPKKSLWRLFLATFQLSAFTFGGGYVIVPLMKKQFVEKMGWISETEMMDFTAIAQSSPGAMAVNASVLVGYHLFGVLGALVSVAGTVLPPLLLLSVISIGYQAIIGNQIIRNILRGMEAGVCAVIIDVVASMAATIFKQKSWYLILLMFGSFIAVTVFDVNVMLVILICVLTGLGTVLRQKRKGGAE